MRVPEAYLLLKQYETTRPGLLVLDADGRRVDSIPLPGMGSPRIAPREIARRLDVAKKSPAIEHWRFTANGSDEALQQLRATLSQHDGVQAVSMDATTFRVKVKATALAPDKLTAYAKTGKVAITIQEPVVVQFATADSASEDSVTKDNTTEAVDAVRALAGTWHTSTKPHLRAYVTGLFLQPAALHKAAGPCDVEERTFDLPEIPKGGPGSRVAMAPLAVPGVLSIHTDIFNERQTVIGRRGHVAWKAVIESFEKAGCKAKARPER